jgi:hypothetical protein
MGRLPSNRCTLQPQHYEHRITTESLNYSNHNGILKLLHSLWYQDQIFDYTLNVTTWHVTRTFRSGHIKAETINKLNKFILYFDDWIKPRIWSFTVLADGTWYWYSEVQNIILSRWGIVKLTDKQIRAGEQSTPLQPAIQPEISKCLI